MVFFFFFTILNTNAAIVDLVNESVLVETFEEGVSVSQYFNKKGQEAIAVNKKLAHIGLEMYLNMMLRDAYVRNNFILISQKKKRTKWGYPRKKKNQICLKG